MLHVVSFAQAPLALWLSRALAKSIPGTARDIQASNLWQSTSTVSIVSPLSGQRGQRKCIRPDVGSAPRILSREHCGCYICGDKRRFIADLTEAPDRRRSPHRIDLTDDIVISARSTACTKSVLLVGIVNCPYLITHIHVFDSGLQAGIPGCFQTISFLRYHSS